jgi:hypothetical protein
MFLFRLKTFTAAEQLDLTMFGLFSCGISCHTAFVSYDEAFLT